MPTRRTFIAIDMPDSIKGYLTSLGDPSIAGVRWIPRMNFHLTMRFVGDIEAEPMEKLQHHLTEVKVSPFTLNIGKVGFFPTKGPPKVIWAGLGTGHPLLFQLRQQIDDAVLRAGINCEMRDFVPHITIGRCTTAHPQSLKTLVSTRDNAHGPVFRVNEFSLFESRLSPRGSQYLEIESFPLS